MMQSEVYLRSQIAATLDGLAAAVQHAPALASNDAADYYYAGYLAALGAVAMSCGIAPLSAKLPAFASAPLMLTGRP